MVQKMRTWVLLRGLTRGKKHWADFSDRLQKKFPSDKVILIDTIGNGELNNQISPTQIEKYVQPIRDKLDTISTLKNEIHIISISMGGMIATEWMRLFPKEISLSILINTSASNFSTPIERLQWQNYIKLISIFFSKKKEHSILKLTSNNKERFLTFESFFQDYVDLQPTSLKSALHQIIAASRYRFPLTSPGKVLLLASKKDRLVSYTCSQAIAHQWKCPLFIHPTAGHDLPLDDPDWILDKIYSFITS